MSLFVAFACEVLVFVAFAVDNLETLSGTLCSEAYCEAEPYRETCLKPYPGTLQREPYQYQEACQNPQEPSYMGTSRTQLRSLAQDPPPLPQAFTMAENPKLPAVKETCSQEISPCELPNSCRGLQH